MFTQCDFLPCPIIDSYTLVLFSFREVMKLTIEAILCNAYSENDSLLVVL